MTAKTCLRQSKGWTLNGQRAELEGVLSRVLIWPLGNVHGVGGAGNLRAAGFWTTSPWSTDYRLSL